MKIILSLLCGLFFYQIAFMTHAEERKKDYALYSAIYFWYAQLDLGVDPEKHTPTLPSLSAGSYDLSHYINANTTAGAHHILDIAIVSENNTQIQVEVTVEYYYQAPQKESETALPGRYLVQRLTLTQAPFQVVASQNIINELDDFNSRFIPSADRNLIRSLVYQWTDLLDHPYLASARRHMDEIIDMNSLFQGAEMGITDPYQYVLLLEALGHSQSRREIKNMRIIPLENKEDSYQVIFEYQWTVMNSLGERELAQIGVKLSVDIVGKRAVINAYQEQYLPPVTDLGAETRC
ncbi:hypothetical protein [Shewanella surugensis]|uniref:Uncharacterized protein n=1 Tax=Shewanella surugensis TaxID=212020 RepID=A0ABT0LBI2_9GAMM|nr:hypothetical protein [Shewanella surugensis]MCL1124860.1 hypothetical protein [Shewanella surugensis]